MLFINISYFFSCLEFIQFFPFVLNNSTKGAISHCYVVFYAFPLLDIVFVIAALLMLHIINEYARSTINCLMDSWVF